MTGFTLDVDNILGKGKVVIPLTFFAAVLFVFFMKDYNFKMSETYYLFIKNESLTANTNESQMKASSNTRKLTFGVRPLTDAIFLVSKVVRNVSSSVAGAFAPSKHKPSQPPPMLILAWTTFFGGKFEDQWEKAERNSCAIWSQCRITGDRKLLADADAVLFHIRNIRNWTALPRHQSVEQRFVFMLYESPSHTPSLQKVNDYFNWTMTYRRDSDIWRPYGNFHNLTSIPNETYDQWLSVVQKKRKLAAWLVSNCHSPSGRELLVKDMQRYMSVDVYGKCGPNRCQDCNRMLEKHYKFYLSFENSICKDYITEKVYDRMPHYIVPVVLSRSIVKDFLPEHSFIAADDFSSSKQLADYLHYLDHNMTAYLKYFEWRLKFSLQRPGLVSLCSLCEKLYQDFVPKFYPDIQNWWHTEGNCTGKFGSFLVSNSLKH